MIHQPYWPTFPIAYCTSTGHPPYQAGRECPECKRLREMVDPPTRCTSRKMGEYNALRCVRQQGHPGEHNYAVYRGVTEKDNG